MENSNGNRWIVAQERERFVADSESQSHVRKLINLRRSTWSHLLLRAGADANTPLRALDIGCGPTSIFLALYAGEEIAVDPLMKSYFDAHPFLSEVMEYARVKFISGTLEGSSLTGSFDIITSINSLDHVQNPKTVTSRISELLSTGGRLILVVDCYYSNLIRTIMRLFDVDVPHPHHFVRQDIEGLFTDLVLVKEDLQVFQIFDSESEMESAGLHPSNLSPFNPALLVGRMIKDMDEWGKRGDKLFLAKFVIAYGLAALVGLTGRKERPVFPLKKARLFVFKKV